MKNTQLKQCPNCKNMVEKAEGCNAVACRCGIQFCFLCGKQIQAAGQKMSSKLCQGCDPYVIQHRNQPVLNEAQRAARDRAAVAQREMMERMQAAAGRARAAGGGGHAAAAAAGGMPVSLAPFPPPRAASFLSLSAERRGGDSLPTCAAGLPACLPACLCSPSPALISSAHVCACLYVCVCASEPAGVDGRFSLCDARDARSRRRSHGHGARRRNARAPSRSAGPGASARPATPRWSHGLWRRRRRRGGAPSRRRAGRREKTRARRRRHPSGFG
jgi:hypothetical protein